MFLSLVYLVGVAQAKEGACTDIRVFGDSRSQSVSVLLRAGDRTTGAVVVADILFHGDRIAAAERKTVDCNSAPRPFAAGANTGIRLNSLAAGDFASS